MESSELTSVVRLPVTTTILVPSDRLPTQELAAVVQRLANQESQKGLIDNGGVFNFPQDATVLANVHPHGFIAAATAAFANHYPLAVRPQHLWMMILQATAVHVGKHAEEIRANWVSHEGKKGLRSDAMSSVLAQRTIGHLWWMASLIASQRRSTTMLSKAWRQSCHQHSQPLSLRRILLSRSLSWT